MNSSKKAKSLDTFPRVRKRNSIGGKTPSHGTHNAVQRRASLLKNNKNLAMTLQETRCELSTYKNFFEESIEYVNKAKLAKSKMVQLSAALKNFVKIFEENILLLDFDESKWPNIKTSAQSIKNYENYLNPVVEVTNEIPEEISFNNETNCNVENGPESQNTSLQKAVDKDKFLTNLQKGAEDSTQNNIKPDSQTVDSSENMDTRTGVCNSGSNLVQNTSLATVPSQAMKTTKIPRCQTLTTCLKKNESKSQNKAFKRKSPEKQGEESDPNFSRRKTFVVKNSNVLTIMSTKNLTVENKNGLLMNESSNVSENEFIPKNSKRQTFVLKNSNNLKENESASNLCSVEDKEVLPQVSVGETTDIQHGPILEDNRRKTFVKKSSDETELQNLPILENNRRKTFVKNINEETELQSNFSELQISFPNTEYAVNSELALAVTKNCENLVSSSNLHCNYSEIDHVVENEFIFAERSKNFEHNAEVSSLNMNVNANASSKDIKENDKISTSNEVDVNDKMTEIAGNLESNIDSDVQNQIAIKAAKQNVSTNKRVMFNDNLHMNENVNKMHDFSPLKTRRSFLESSESESEMILIDEFNFGDIKPTLQTTPIRRKILQNKKKKFVFGSKNRKSILKKKSCKITDCQTGDNCPEINIGLSDVHTSGNDINKNRKKDDVISMSDELVNEENPVNLQSDAPTVKVKNTKTSTRKNKGNKDAPIKNIAGKVSNKTQKTKNNKKNLPHIEIDSLLPSPKKIKKKKKTICFDDTAISKFAKVDKAVKLNEVKGIDKEPESDYICKKTGKNTFLVRAEIHAPPPSTSGPLIKENKKTNEKLDLQHMQVTVVLDDILKSKNIEHLNIFDRDLLCGGAVSLKTSLPNSPSNFIIDPEESIERLRCNSVSDVDDFDLYSDAVLDTVNTEVKGDPIHDTGNPRPRRRKEVNYKEPSLHRKMRRC